MTKAIARFRKRGTALLRDHGWLAAILVLATVLRLDGIGFGLPALNDPDEPLFIMLAIDMLQRGSLDPQWFGHPGTITLYCLALIIAGTAAFSLASGQFADAEAFVRAVYLDPGLIILPARLFIAANGVVCVYLTYRIGRTLWGQAAGLIAAFVLAINAVHIAWSQVIRTDVQASVFMLACCLAAIAMLEDPRRRHCLIAGLFAGLACATKWPAALVLLGPIAVSLDRLRRDQSRAWDLPLVGATTVIALLLVSPYLVFSHDIVLRDLAGEARASHPGATGSGPLGNLVWYLSEPLAGSLGWAGLALAIGGAIGATWKGRGWSLATLPPFVGFLFVISAQALIWERWLVPVLPFLALGCGWSLSRLAALTWPKGGRTARAGTVAATIVLALPMLASDHARSRERGNDTRQLASAWVKANVPEGSAILVEHAAIDLLRGPWTILFPLGSAGCVDARRVLGETISSPQVEGYRKGSPVVDIGHLARSEVAACNADVIVTTNMARYRAERRRFPVEYRRYTQLTQGFERAANMGPIPAERGGPAIEIWTRRHFRASPD